MTDKEIEQKLMSDKTLNGLLKDINKPERKLPIVEYSKAFKSLLYGCKQTMAFVLGCETEEEKIGVIKR